MDEDDAYILQEDLDKLYKWAEDNNMAFNGTKFECLKYGPNKDLKGKYNYLNPEVNICIEDKTSVRDLGIQMSEFAI